MTTSTPIIHRERTPTSISVDDFFTQMQTLSRSQGFRMDWPITVMTATGLRFQPISIPVEGKRHSDDSDKKKSRQFKYLDITKVKHPKELFDFVRWCAVPKKLRVPSTQKEFALRVGVDEDVLTAWKQRCGFWDEVGVYRVDHYRAYTTDICGVLVKSAMRGELGAIKLFLQLFEGFRE